VKENEVVVSSLRKSLLEILSVQEIDLLKVGKKPYLITFLGFNGAGKTTSMAKVASWLKENNKSCVFAAADTFRAAAEEQLEAHAKRIGVKMIKHKYGADPAAVIFDAVEHAKANGIDFVLADTAGRAHTNKNLMDQMGKIVRVNKPDLKILVIDSLTGNDALIQAQMFNEIGVDGLIFTKVDVNEKGGAILSVTHELKKPILFLGLGQEYKDFEKFDKEKFVSLLLS
jgi:fused signal recognition particle receptor